MNASEVAEGSLDDGGNPEMIEDKGHRRMAAENLQQGSGVKTGSALSRQQVGSVGLLVFAFVFAAASMAAAEKDGAALVREDLTLFLEAGARGPGVSIEIPPLSAFQFDRQKYPGELRTNLSSRMEPPYRGRVAVAVSLFAGERMIKRAIVSPYVQVEEEVVVAARDLRRGEVLSRHDLEVAQRDQARLGRGFYGAVEDVLGMRMKRSVRRGKVIVATATEDVPVVERGDRVIVVLESGAMKLQSIGRAQETGSIGEWIRVVNLESKKEIMGRLDSAGRVHVAF